MKIFSGAAVRGEGDVAGEGELVGVPKFHSWDKCTMASGLHYTTRVLYFTSSGEITLREFFNSPASWTSTMSDTLKAQN